MSSSWLLKTRQMSEAGKEIILTEALVNHMRSPRDRQLVMGSFTEKHPLEDVLSYFGAYYLYHYQGVKLLRIDATEDVSIEEVAASENKERELLEIEVRKLLGEKQRQEIDTCKISSRFMIEACTTLEGKIRSDESVDLIIGLLKKYVQMIPLDYSHNNEIDFLNEITGNGIKWRNELYSKASGLKESSLSLREELLKPHPEEIIEMSVLKNGIENVLGTAKLLEKRILTDEYPDDKWDQIANSIIERILDTDSDVIAIKTSYEIRLSVLDVLEQELKNPTTLEEYEANIGQVIVDALVRLTENNPGIIYEVLGYLSGIPIDDVISTFRLNRITDPTDIVSGLKVSSTTETPAEVGLSEGPSYTKEELEEMTRSLKFLEKIEYTLEKPVKGMLKAKGFGGMDLENISIDFLLKDRSKLLAIEERVLEELKGKKLRIPSPQEMQRLIQLREEFKSGALTGSEVSTSAEIRGQLEHGKSMESLRLDLVWYFTIGVLKNLARVVETYIRSKKDIQRAKTLLKSIYDDSEAQLQFLREEILIDLFSLRLYEMKVVHPEMDATSVCSWFHARLTNKDLESAKIALDKSASPVFEGIRDASLNLSALTFDNYAIAFDLMQRFLVQQRGERDIRQEVAAESRKTEQKIKDEKLASLDVLNFVYTKAHTVFRAIGRVGARGLEWSANDDSKCANLLSFFLRQNRGKLICSVCGDHAPEKKCKTHGKGNINEANDIDSLAWFVMRSFTDIKEGLLGGTAEPMPWDKARSIVQREISTLRRRGKITSKTNLKALMPGDINYIVGPAIARVIGKYFNESLEYAARRAGIA
ncbi:MAG: hypothetical protein ACFFF4_08810 [Candidatus Thorarchaeota archaeon]